MATEILQRPNGNDNPTQEGNESGDSLRPDLEDYDDYNKRNRNAAKGGGAETSQNPISGNSLVIEPIFGRTGQELKLGETKADRFAQGDQNNEGDQGDETDEITDGDEKDEVKGDKRSPTDQADNPENGKDIALAPETQRAKDNFNQVLRDRLRDDPRFQQNPELLKTLEASMAQMDQRVLHERVQKADGTFVDQQEQLAKEYRNLSRIGTDAEKLTYTAADGTEQKVFSKPWMVNNILAGGIMRGADPEHFSNQGHNNTCASESVGRQGSELMIGEDSSTIADILTKGEFAAVDSTGKPFVCTVDKASLIPDREAQSIYMSPSDARDAYGQASDVRTAQLNLDLISREQEAKKGRAGGEGRYQYREVPPESQRDSGERVVDTWRGDRVIANHPCLDGKGVSNVKQSLYGRYIDPNFGKDTTLVSDRAFDIDNATQIRSGAHMTEHMRNLDAKGWGMPTVATYGVNCKEGQGAGSGTGTGWHATSVKLNENGNLDFVNNWGGYYDKANMGADELFAWMNAPAGTEGAAGQRSDHVLSPGEGYANGDRNPARSDLAQNEDQKRGIENKGNKEEDELLAQLKKEKHQEENNRQKQAETARTQLAELEARLAHLPADSSLRLEILARKNGLRIA